jgi:hypothetical protein
LALSGIARAKDDDEDGKRCSISTLRGLYVFTASGFNIVAGVPQPKAIVELIRFDGRGAATVPAVTVSINGVIMNAVPESVEYTLDSDCTGSLQFIAPGTGPITYDLFVSSKGSVIHMIQTNQNTVFQGTAERVSR